MVLTISRPSEGVKKYILEIELHVKRLVVDRREPRLSQSACGDFCCPDRTYWTLMAILCRCIRDFLFFTSLSAFFWFGSGVQLWPPSKLGSQQSRIHCWML
jgi:hypothetical protein